MNNKMTKSYKIEWMENKVTGGGKKFIKASLSDGTRTVDDVAIWDSFPGFDGLQAGSEVQGDLVEKQNGQYVNRSLYAPYRPKPAGTSSGGSYASNKGNFGAKMMEKKAENIREAQDRKNDSIAFFNATNSAIAIVAPRYQDLTIAEFKETISNWRDWFLSEWEKYNNPTSPVDIDSAPKI